MKWKWRLFWLSTLFLLWLLCSGVAGAEPLADRLTQYPNWQGKPSLQSVRKEDLIYPTWFAGNWTVTTILVDVVAPFAPAIVTPGFESNRQFLDQPISFQVRFVETQPATLLAGFRKSPKQLVSDRAYNGKQLAKAYLGDRVVVVKVDPDNPNRQITLLQGDKQLVSTVTARATELLTSNQFITSEFFKQEFRGAPQIYFNEVENTTAYTRQTPDSITQPAIIADQITAIYLSPQDPNYFKTLTGNNPFSEPRPVALYRYHMKFFRNENPV